MGTGICDREQAGRHADTRGFGTGSGGSGGRRSTGEEFGSGGRALEADLAAELVENIDHFIQLEGAVVVDVPASE